MRRAWLLVPVGAILTGSATFFYGMVFFQHAWPGLTMRDLAIWLVVVGSTTGALIGLVMVRLTSPSLRPRTRAFLLGLLGMVCGLIPALVYGFNIEQSCIDDGTCGWSFLGWVLPSFWFALGMAAAVGAILGALGGVAAARLTRLTPIQLPSSP
jgi:glucan phosphoethanolaminetransferase (alkaline phosphatase superfamily)